jgi:hypothetical protein
MYWPIGTVVVVTGDVVVVVVPDPADGQPGCAAGWTSVHWSTVSRTSVPPAPAPNATQ